MRRLTIKAVWTVSRSRLSCDIVSYCEIRKQYQHLLLTKEKEYNLKCTKELESNIRDPKQFYTAKKQQQKNRQVCDISDEKWLKH